MLSDASCEESSVYEGAGYDEAFGLGDESEDFSPSLERETSAQSRDGDVESYAKGSEEVQDKGEDEVEEGKKGSGSENDDDTMIRMMMMVTRNPVKGLQWVLEITVLLFSLRIRPSTGFYL